MIILPAIDIKDGKCVRLYKGDFASVEQVADSAIDTALSFEQSGAKWLHMVDLDGAKIGKPYNTDIFTEVAQSCNLKMELGGGIRSMKDIEYYINHGIERTILGSAAISDPQFVKQAAKEFQDKIAVGIDAKNGKVAANGWLDTSNIDYIELAKRMEDIGIKYIIFTDISKDGTLSGPNLEQLDAINKAVSCNIIASGGVTNSDDIKALLDLGVYGAICGKSLYKGTLKLTDAIEIAGKQE